MTTSDPDGSTGPAPPKLAPGPRESTLLDHASADARVTRARRLLRERGQSVRDRQLASALDEFDGSAREEAVLATLADRLVARLLAGPRTALLIDEDGERVAATVERLFE